MFEVSHKRGLWSSLILSLFVLGASFQGTSAGTAQASASAKKVCKTVKKHGKKVKVCHAVKVKPTATATATTTPLPAPPTVPAPPNPVTVTAHLDTPHAVSQLMTSKSGGTLTTTGSDGTVYTLTIPSNAVSDDTQITMTPIAGIDSLPTGATLAAGVQLQPDGLTLYQPGTLIIQPAKSVSLTSQGSVSYNGTGTELHLEPLHPVADRVQFDVLHFSGRAMLDMRPAFRYYMWTHPPTSVPAQFDQQIEVAVSQWRSDQITQAEFVAQILTSARALYTSDLLPHAQAAGTSDEALQLAIDEYMGIIHRLNVLTLLGSFETERATLFNLIKAGLMAALNRASAHCGTQSRTLTYVAPYWVVDPTTFNKIVALERTAILGYQVAVDDPALAKAEATCRPRGYKVFSPFTVRWHVDDNPPQIAADYKYSKFSDTDQTFSDLHVCGSSPEGTWTSPLTTHVHSETWDGRVSDTTSSVDSGYVQVTSAYSTTTPSNSSYDKGVLSLHVIPQLDVHFHRVSGTTYHYNPGDQDMTFTVVEDSSCPPLRR